MKTTVAVIGGIALGFGTALGIGYYFTKCDERAADRPPANDSEADKPAEDVSSKEPVVGTTSANPSSDGNAGDQQ